MPGPGHQQWQNWARGPGVLALAAFDPSTQRDQGEAETPAPRFLPMKQKGLKFEKKQNFAKADNYLDNLDKNFFFFNYLFYLFLFALNYSFLHSFICVISIE